MKKTRSRKFRDTVPLIYVKNQEIIVIWVVFSIGKYRELSARTLFMTRRSQFCIKRHLLTLYQELFPRYDQCWNF